jgi:seryl-tRNA synthetase
MLDRKFIFENIDAVKENCANRNLNIKLDSFVELETSRRAKLQESEELNQKANAASKQIGKASDDAERESLKEEARPQHGTSGRADWKGRQSQLENLRWQNAAAKVRF